MTGIPRTVRWRKHICHLMSLGLLLALCVGCTPSYVSGSDPNLDAIRKALQDEDKDPSATSQTLDEKLHRVQDKQIVEVLLDYLEDRRHKGELHDYNIGKAVFYLAEISGIESHIDLTFAGPVYLDFQDWDRDIAQWREWWNANRDYIVWDEQSGKLRVTRP